MTALMDAVAAATAAVPRLYRLGSVPTAPTYPYGVYSASAGRGDAYTLDSSHGIRHGGVTVQTFGKTADSAVDHMDKVTARLLDVSLTVGSRPTTPLRAAFDSPRLVRDPDDQGVIGATQQFQFTTERET